MHVCPATFRPIELIRFSPTTMRHLVVQLGKLSKDDSDRLRDMIQHNLVASNMFIRSLLYTLPLVGPETSDVVVKFVGLTQQVHLVARLAMVVSVSDVHQESLCCVSTFMSFCLMAQRQGGLPALLKSLATYPGASDMQHGAEGDDAMGVERAPPCPHRGAAIFSNLRGLLRVWRVYYNSKCRLADLISLERGSKIPRAEWLAMVELLLRPLPTTAADGMAGDGEVSCTLAYWERTITQ